MAQVAIKDTNVAAAGGAIDRAHLARMTFGEAALERELLELFDRQAAILVARMHASDATTVAALAHTLKGSAVGVGAGEVAATAAAVEQSPSPERLAALGRSVERARAAIAGILR
jgi:HPt (histidine-containing phosphotransfer) domain-containing protein